MTLKDGLTDEEFTKLVERLSSRKQQDQELINPDLVNESLTELGLSHLLTDSDIEEVRKQVDRELKKQQRRKNLTFTFILLAITIPLSVFGGYKLNDLVDKYFGNQGEEELLASLQELEKKLRVSETDKKVIETEKEDLEDKIKELEEENKSLKDSLISNLPTGTTTETTPTEPSSLGPNPGGIQQVQSLIFELKECQKSTTSSTLQNINCSFLVTSNQDKAKLYVYANYNSDRRSRIVEGGKEFIAKKVNLGSNSGSSRAENNLIKDIPIEITLTFEEVPQSLNKIDVIELSSYLETADFNDDIKVEFRDTKLGLT